LRHDFFANALAHHKQDRQKVKRQAKLACFLFIKGLDVLSFVFLLFFCPFAFFCFDIDSEKAKEKTL